MQPKVGKTKQEIKQIVGAARSKKRVDLSKQFQQFKQRIQQFQNKNEEIISRIRDAYSTKKRAVMSKEPSPNPNPANHAFYKNCNDRESVSSSCDYSKNVVLEGNMIRAQPHPQIQSIYNSNVDEYETAQKQRIPQYKSTQQLVSNHSIRSSNIVPTQAHQASYEDYMRNMRLRTEENDVPNDLRGVETKMVHLPYPDEDHFAELEEKYKQEIMRNQQLEEILHTKEEEMAKLKNQQLRFKSYSSNLKHIVEDGLQAYQEQVVAERFLQLQKYMRKCQLRLKNLSLRLKDSLEEKRSRRIIHKSRSKRNSISKNKKESSMSEEAESTPKISRACSQSKAKNRSDNLGKHKEFQQIAGDYENMIKTKVQEIENLQRRVNEETSVKELTANELMKCKALLQQKERELSNLKRMRKPVKEEPTDGRELKQLKERISKLQQEIAAKEHKEKEMGELIQKLQRAKKSQHQEYVENINKNKMLKNKAIQQLQTKLKEIENGNQKLIAELRERVGVADKKTMERECEMMAVLTKLKKVENQCLIKQEKLKELEGLLLKENDHGDLLDRSMSMDTSVLSQTEIRHLHENIRRLQQEIQEGKSIIYDLQKDKHLLESANSEYEGHIALLSRNNAALELKVGELRRELENTRFEDQRDSTRELQERNELIEEQYQAEKELWLQEKEELSTRNGELMQELKRIKENNLAINRELIKTTSELNFNRNQQSNLEGKLSRCKEELNTQKLRYEEFTLQRKQREDQLLGEVATLRDQVENLRNHILELQTMGSRNNLDNKDEDMLLNSLHVSEVSFNYQPKQSQEEEVAALRERLREVEMVLDIKTGMEEQIQKEYRSNLEILRLDNLQKNKEIQRYKTEMEQCRSELEKMRGLQRQDQSFQNYKLQIYKEKIVQMEEEYNALKDSEERLNEMLHEIVETVKSRDQQRERILRELDDKQKIIEQFKELLDIKQIKQSHNKTMKTDTLKEFSLRISGDHSEELIDTAELSYLSNISDVFKRDDILQERIKKGKTSREEQVKLFAKTSAYIKSLKTIIQTKDKRIKMLEKQISSMKSNENKSWSDKERSLSQRPYYTQQYVENDDVEECDEYKDYQSVQLDTRRSRYHEMVKQLQNEKNLAVEENKLLNKQIEALHEEIMRSEEQENSLVRIKDLYKDEIKKLIEKNEIHTKEFQVQIKKLKDELESSESYHNLEAIRQLFVKIVAVIASLEQGNTKHRKDEKREEKRKQLDEYIKIMSSILQLQTNPKANFKK